MQDLLLADAHLARLRPFVKPPVALPASPGVTLAPDLLLSLSAQGVNNEHCVGRFAWRLPTPIDGKPFMITPWLLFLGQLGIHLALLSSTLYLSFFK